MRSPTRHIPAIFAAALLGAGAAASHAQSYFDQPPQIRGLDVEEHIGRALPMELSFSDETGRTVTLGEYFKDNSKPVLIMLVYFECPIVCDLLMAKQTEVFERLDYTVGDQFKVLFFSFDPREGPERAAKAKADHIIAYGRRDTPGVAENWRFLVGTKDANQQLADALGFQYRELPDGNFSHPLAQFIITPDGRVSRYLYGYPEDATSLKLALMEASEGKLVQSIGERLISFCYRYDSSQGKYTLQVVRVMQLGGAITLLGVGTLIGVLVAGERIRNRRNGAVHAADKAAIPGVHA